MKEGQAVGKTVARETKIEKKLRKQERVGGKQEEGNLSKGREDQKIIRDGCAFALER